MENINWIDTKKSVPPVDNDDNFNKEYGYSKKVLIWLEHKRGESECRFGLFIHHNKYTQWVVDGITGGNYEVTHYANINSPF